MELVTWSMKQKYLLITLDAQRPFPNTNLYLGDTTTFPCLEIKTTCGTVLRTKRYDTTPLWTLAVGIFLFSHTNISIIQVKLSILLNWGLGVEEFYIVYQEFI